MTHRKAPPTVVVVQCDRTYPPSSSITKISIKELLPCSNLTKQSIPTTHHPIRLRFPTSPEPDPPPKLEPGPAQPVWRDGAVFPCAVSTESEQGGRGTPCEHGPHKRAKAASLLGSASPSSQPAGTEGQHRARPRPKPDCDQGETARRVRRTLQTFTARTSGTPSRDCLLKQPGLVSNCRRWKRWRGREKESQARKPK